MLAAIFLVIRSGWRVGWPSSLIVVLRSASESCPSRTSVACAICLSFARCLDSSLTNVLAPMRGQSPARGSNVRVSPCT
jgi:hypothetical protein